MYRLREIITIIIALITINYSYAVVRFIQATIRHAARNPVDGSYSSLYYPSDPYINEKWLPDGPMEITNSGKLGAYKLGQFLRSRYNDLLGAEYRSNLARFNSAQMTRAMNTIQAVAAGIFPPTQRQKWHPQLSWIPIPIYVTPAAEDKLNYALGFCENYRNDRNKSDGEVNRLLAVISDIQELFEFLTNHTGVKHTYCTQGWILYHQLAAQADLGLKFEPWIDKVFPNGKLVDIAAIEYTLQTYTERMKRVVGGVWIKEFLNHVDNMINSVNQQLKATFYGTNEMQIAAILNALGAYKPHVPGYASTIIFELHEVAEEFYVKVLYRNEDQLMDLIIPGCENNTICSLVKFKSALKNVITDDFDAECGKRVEFQIIKNVKNPM